MDHYQDIRLLPDPEFQTSTLMNALFAKLHRALVQREEQSIGISFPKVNSENLGDTLRLHSSSSALESLKQSDWLKGMRDHIDVTEVTSVPEVTKHCCVSRKQAKSSAERLRRRYRKRHQGVTEEEVAALIPDSMEKRLKLPYLQLRSESTGQRFRLFIEHGKPQENAVDGKFNSYGLSITATVPWF